MQKLLGGAALAAFCLVLPSLASASKGIHTYVSPACSTPAKAIGKNRATRQPYEVIGQERIPGCPNGMAAELNQDFASSQKVANASSG
jgi:hypothetical protein